MYDIQYTYLYMVYKCICMYVCMYTVVYYYITLYIFKFYSFASQELYLHG